MQKLRLIFIALIGFIGVLIFSSTSSHTFFDKYEKADAALPSNSAVVTSKDFGVVQKDQQKIAGCLFGICTPKIPVSIPNISIPKTPAPAPAPTQTPSTPRDNSNGQSAVTQGDLTSTGAGLTDENPIDPNWKVNNKNAFLTRPSPYYTVQPPPGASAQWIGPKQNSALISLPSGSYAYTYVFNGGDMTSVSGEFSSDNETEKVLLNDVPLGIHNDFSNSFASPQPFTFQPIQHQLNTLTFIVQNWGNYSGDPTPSQTGLYVRFTRTDHLTRKPVPGDIVVYRLNGEITHSGVISEVGLDHKTIIKVKSKWGTGSLYEHDPLDVPKSYGSWIAYHTPRQGHNLLKTIEKPVLGGSTTNEIYVTDKGRIVPQYKNWYAWIENHLEGKGNAEPQKPTEDEINLYSRLKTIDRGPIYTYDCHGYTFTDGNRWIGFETNHGNEVELILEDNGYTIVPALDTKGFPHPDLGKDNINPAT